MELFHIHPRQWRREEDDENSRWLDHEDCARFLAVRAEGFKITWHGLK